jgi:hypothetical protein
MKKKTITHTFFYRCDSQQHKTMYIVNILFEISSSLGFYALLERRKTITASSYTNLEKAKLLSVR